MKNIFLHGLGQTSSSWKKTIPHIGEASNIICPDLFELLHGKEISYENLYHAFSKYCKSFSEPLNLCGLSLGGILALQYAIENPSKVNSIVLVGTQYRMPKKLLTFQNMMFHILPKSMFEQMGIEKKECIHLSKTMMDLNFEQKLNTITCPVLVVCGEKDKANKKASIELKEQIPNGELVIIENAGHEVNEDAPEKLGEVIKSFFSKTI